MQMRSSSMWFALAAAAEPERAFTGAGVKPNMRLVMYSFSIPWIQEEIFPKKFQKKVNE